MNAIELWRPQVDTPITVGELFAGIGGFSLAFHAAGARTAWFVEKEPYCQQVLQKNFPGVPVHGDIYECHELPYVDVITAGFPCQPFSLAGKRQGENDERYLVPEMFRVIQEVQPRVCFFENVPGFANIADGDTFREFLRALAEIGYDAEWDHFRASDIGAPHQRERWLCVAYGDSGRQQQRVSTIRHLPILSANRQPLVYPQQFRTAAGAPRQTWSAYPHAKRHRPAGQPRRYAKQSGVRRAGQLGNTAQFRLERQRPTRKQIAIASRKTAVSNGTIRLSQPRLGRAAHGIPARLDGHQWPARPGEPQHPWEPSRVTDRREHRTQRLKALGNAVVPQVVYPIACEIVARLQAENEQEKVA